MVVICRLGWRERHKPDFCHAPCGLPTWTGNAGRYVKLHPFTHAQITLHALVQTFSIFHSCSLGTWYSEAAVANPSLLELRYAVHCMRLSLALYLPVIRNICKYQDDNNTKHVVVESVVSCYHIHSAQNLRLNKEIMLAEMLSELAMLM